MGPDTLGIMIPIIAVFMGLLIPIVHQITDYRRRRDIVEAHHKERLAGIERGMEIPPLPEAFFKPFEKSNRPRHLLTGMIWLFIGIALYIFLGAITEDEPGVAYLGLIPGGIGLAFLIYYFVEGRNELAEYKARMAAKEAATSPGTALQNKTL